MPYPIAVTALALTFLDPMSGIAAGVLGGLGLLTLYFLKLRRRPVRVSSTLLWQTSVADLQVNVPFRWLRPSWLLLLQLIGLVCLAAALARPAISSEGSGSAPVILLIDRSASMSALDAVGSSETEPKSRLDAAKDRAQEILTLLPTDTPAAVASFASEAVGQTNLTKDRSLLRQAVQSITPTDQPGDVEAAFELVRALTARSTEVDDTAVPRAVLLSDGSFDTSRPTKGTGRASLEFVQVGPGPNVPGSALDNAGIVALAARRDYEDPATVRLFVRVQSVTPHALDLPLACRLGESSEPFASAILSVPPGTEASPADASRTFEFQNTEGGLVTVSLSRPDSLAADDAAGLVLSRAAALNIVLVRPNIATDALDEIVRAALEAIGPASLRVMNAGEFENALQAAPLGADLLVFDRVRPSRLTPTPSLSFGATVPIPGLGVSATGEGEKPRPTGVAYWLRSHPVMRYVVLDDVWVNEPLRMSLPAEDSTAPGTPTVRVESLASGADGPLIVLAEQEGIRRILVGFDLGQSNWVKDAGFHIFLKNAIDYLTLTGEDEAGPIIRTTATVPVRIAPGSRRIEVAGPTSLSRETSGGAGERITVGPFPLAGKHTLSGVVEPDATMFVSLLDPFESRIGVRDALETAGLRTEAISASSVAPREVWHWFVLAAVALLMIEWFIFALRMRV